MMSYMEKLKLRVIRFMQGRYGPDQLSLVLIYGAFAFYIIDLFCPLGFSTIGLALSIYATYRLLSRNKEKRYAENQRFLAWWNPRVLKFRQARKRFQMRKQYKYFKCPQCKSWLRLPHGAGKVNVTCGRCHNKFIYKA